MHLYLFDQEDVLMYSRPPPQSSHHVLKNTNIEAEMMSRRDRDLRRVHYTLHEEEREHEEYLRWENVNIDYHSKLDVVDTSLPVLRQGSDTSILGTEGTGAGGLTGGGAIESKQFQV